MRPSLSSSDEICWRFALLILLRCLTGAREIAQELTGVRQFGETDRVAPVRLHPITRLLGDKRGSNHDALVAKA